jgi:hypothetical protein
LVGSFTRGVVVLEVDKAKVRDHQSDTEDQQVEEPLGAGSDVLGEYFIDKDIERRKEECVADAVQDLDEDDQGLPVLIAEE